MTNEKKTFDCVEMKHQGAERVQARLEGMTREEQLAYWEQRGRVLRARQQEVIARKKAS
jgi:hypothetical protein